MARKARTHYAILGLLCWKPMSGYDIKKMVEVGLSYFWSESYGQIFPTLNRLVDDGLATGGRIIHELGVTRMGDDPSTSVLNGNCQAHDVANLFVTDGGPFVSQADKNPTWTILALAWRTGDYIVEQRNAGAL